MRKVNLIVAVDEAGGFGKDGRIPWHFPEDLKHFQKITTGSTCIMGRKTYDDIKWMKAKAGAKPSKILLPTRDCYVVSSTLPPLHDVTITKSIREATDACDVNKPIFVIGGERMFTQALSFTERVYMTIVEGDYDCDRKFPINVLNKWFTIEAGHKSEDGKLSFMTYKRI